MQPGSPRNRGEHVGLNLDRHWEDFKDLDVEDQQIVQAWLLSGQPAPPPSTEAQRQPLLPGMLVQHELTPDQFLGEKYLDIPGNDLSDRVLDVLRARHLFRADRSSFPQRRERPRSAV